MATNDPPHTGDTGYTHLADGNQARKDSALLSAQGELEETSMAIGVAVTLGYLPEEFDTLLRKTQQTLAALGRKRPEAAEAGPTMLAELDDVLAARDTELISEDFAVCSEHSDTAALLKLARAVTRRAERTLWALSQEDPSARSAAVLLNRIADVLLVAAFRTHHESAPQAPIDPRRITA